MALPRILSPRICTRTICPILFHCFSNSASCRKSTVIEIDDALDNFTTELMQKKLKVWDMKAYNKKVMRNPSADKTIDTMNMSTNQISEVFVCKFNECDDFSVIELVKECLKHKICPKKNIILQILYICAQKGEVILIQQLKALYISQGINFSSNFDFSLYEAQAIWMKGNVIKALDIFWNLYINDPFLRRRIKLLVKQLMFHEAKNNSQAILVHLVKFSEKIIEHNKDYFPMICVWEVCFLSEWFSDQQIALELTRKHRRLSEVLIHRLPYILAVSLKSHKTEAVYRLLEIYLDFNLSDHYTLIIMALLDYQFFQGNVRNYSETVKWCEGKNINLPSIYKKKYLQLLLSNEDIDSSSPSSIHKQQKKYEFLF